ASPFYAAALSASGARVTVRDWLDTTVGAARESLGRYFGLQRIVGPYGEEGAPLGVWTLAAATVRDPAKDLAPATVPALLRLALGGGVLPVGLLHQAVRRNYAEQEVTRPRAALIKMVLGARGDFTKGDAM